MEAPSIPTAARHWSEYHSAQLLRVGVLAAIALLWAVALLLIVRRISGGLAVPLAPPSLLAVGTLAALYGWTLRSTWNSVRPKPSPRWLDTLVCWAPSAALLLLAIALSLKDTSTGGLLLFWGVLIASEAEMLRRSRREGQPKQPSPPLRSLAEGHLPGSLLAGEEFAEEDEDFLQKVTRLRDEDGSDALRAVARAEFEPHQRWTDLNVAFCPPFAGVPKLEIEQIDGPEARLKPTQVLPYGARIEVRLAQPATESTHLTVELSVRDKPADDSQTS